MRFIAVILVAVVGLILLPPAAGAIDCGFENPEWRGGFDAGALGAEVEPDPVCAPDDPRVVGVSVLGANNAPDSLMVDTSLSSRAVGKSDDIDSDGDHDIVDAELEILTVAENGSKYGWGAGDERWIFAPKTRGVGVDDTVVRPPSPTLRVEKDNLMFIWVENSNSLSHTVTFDGVNVGSSRTAYSADAETIHPGDSGMYTLRPSESGVYTYYSERNDIDTEMGLAGMIVVEEDRPENQLQSYNVGGGKVRAPSKRCRRNLRR